MFLAESTVGNEGSCEVCRLEFRREAATSSQILEVMLMVWSFSKGWREECNQFCISRRKPHSMASERKGRPSSRGRASFKRPLQ